MTMRKDLFFPHGGHCVEALSATSQLDHHGATRFSSVGEGAFSGSPPFPQSPAEVFVGSRKIEETICLLSLLWDLIREPGVSLFSCKVTSQHCIPL